MVAWYIFPRFGILDQEKSGNLDCACCFQTAFRKAKTMARLFFSSKKYLKLKLGCV
jgi:hypothetical protein